jgi:transcriptional regulator with XRE-family HTH domain
MGAASYQLTQGSDGEPERAHAEEIGRALKRARTARRISLDQASGETYIKRQFLEALESNAPPEAFPAPVYGRAFLREYARYLGLDPDPMLAVWDPPRPSLDGEHLSEQFHPPEHDMRRRHVPRSVAMLAFGAALLSALFFLGRNEENSVGATGLRPSAPPSSAPASQPAAPAAPSPAAPAAPVVAQAIDLELRVEGEACWVRAVTDGVEQFGDTLPVGSVRALHAQRRIDLVLGNAGAARLTINGTPLDLAARSGEVRRFSILLQNGNIRLVPPQGPAAANASA